MDTQAIAAKPPTTRTFGAGTVAGIVAGVAMAMYAMLAAVTYQDSGFFTPLYHIASTFIEPTAMETSMQRAMNRRPLLFLGRACRRGARSAHDGGGSVRTDLRKHRANPSCPRCTGTRRRRDLWIRGLRCDERGRSSHSGGRVWRGQTDLRHAADGGIRDLCGRASSIRARPRSMASDAPAGRR